MKTQDIAKKYNIDKIDFEIFIRKKELKFKDGLFSGMEIEDSRVERYVKQFKEYMIACEEEKRIENELKEREMIEEPIKKKAMAEMLITSGFSFDGYTITKYSGYISEDDTIFIDRGLQSIVFGMGTIRVDEVNIKDKLMKSIVDIRRNAIRKLKEDAYALGCNAVIGVDFDYFTLDISGNSSAYLPYVFGVTANGNAVVIEKNKE